MKIAPSILSADFAQLGSEVRAVMEHVEWIHCDVMDGHFVPNISFGPDVVAAVRKTTQCVVDVHLMISEPQKYIEAFAKAGADYITVHTETCDVPAVIQQIHAAGKKAGICIKPNTPVEEALKYLDTVDLVLVMSVEPGFGGQKFMESALEKIRALRQAIDEKSLSVLISVDGGINDTTAQQVREAGVDIAVAGSYIFKSEDYTAAIKRL